MEKETIEEASKRIAIAFDCDNYKAIMQLIIDGAKWQAERMYSEEDMIEASKYGYNFHKTTSFPEQEFEDSCIRNTKQWLTTFKKK